jgi:hypothetical protein
VAGIWCGKTGQYFEDRSFYYMNAYQVYERRCSLFSRWRDPGQVLNLAQCSTNEIDACNHSFLIFGVAEIWGCKDTGSHVRLDCHSAARGCSCAEILRDGHRGYAWSASLLERRDMEAESYYLFVLLREIAIGCVAVFHLTLRFVAMPAKD